MAVSATAAASTAPPASQSLRLIMRLMIDDSLAEHLYETAVREWNTANELNQ
jgi:hypothetical protein